MQKLGVVEPSYSNGFTKRTGNIQLFSVVHSWLCNKTACSGTCIMFALKISQNAKGIIESMVKNKQQSLLRSIVWQNKEQKLVKFFSIRNLAGEKCMAHI